MENERFEFQNVVIPLKWQLPAPKCCNLQAKRTEQQIQRKIQNGKTIIPKTIPDPLYNFTIWITIAYYSYRKYMNWNSLGWFVGRFNYPVGES